MDNHQIVIDTVAYGWESESWQGFYPSDLPEDWRLDFYCNEFRAVVVPADLWQQIDVDILEDWQDTVHDEFSFYFEANSQQVADMSTTLREMIESLGHHWGGWICRDDGETKEATPSVWYEGGIEPRQMREVVEQLHEKLGEADRGVVVVNSPDEPWEVASNMRQLVELMGYG